MKLRYSSSVLDAGEIDIQMVSFDSHFANSSLAKTALCVILQLCFSYSPFFTSYRSRTDSYRCTSSFLLMTRYPSFPISETTRTSGRGNIPQIIHELGHDTTNQRRTNNNYRDGAHNNCCLCELVTAAVLTIMWPRRKALRPLRRRKLDIFATLLSVGAQTHTEAAPPR